MTDAPWKILKEHRCFGGYVRYLEHASESTASNMRFSVFVPDSEIRGCIFWLSGLTCTEENFMAKAGAQMTLARHGLMIVCPDTSPRGIELPAVREHWDFGEGAGFYVDAVTPGYAKHYRMYSYVTKDLYNLIAREFKVERRISIMGHSMGGHGALIMGLREPQLFCSVSAFAPIVHPSVCPWGRKALKGYLGDQQPSSWADYDACEILRQGHKHPRKILIDQGLDDQFLVDQLLTDQIRDAAVLAGQDIEIRMQAGYDHSYYFIASFVGSHIDFHAKFISSR